MESSKVNAVLLLAKNYLRLGEITVSVFADSIADSIEMENVPAPLIQHYEKKIRKMIFKEQVKNYWRLGEITVESHLDSVKVCNVPAPLIQHYEKKIRKMIFKDQRRVLRQITSALKKEGC